MKYSLLIAFAGSAAAFAPAPQGAASTTLSASAKSPAVPFLPYPENVRGYVGDDIGFDPLRFSDYFPMDYLREAEIKHGRVSMMAITGFVAVDLGFHLPFAGDVKSAAAHDFGVTQGALGLVGLVVGAVEMTSWIAVQEMLQGSGRDAGDFGFGNKFLDGKDEAAVKLMKYKELKNGRLAMFAIGGAVTQSVLTGHGFPYV
eukprot:CAMPEP_0119012234 /NCGR_PEP_ID=MMETSP1176-20130426/6158_1 /TAXON_ID=265551 /ORGANISM="Synedropsis recta cf, Strain CCMP1620" /LENGTH=200 /DNA_ID=CAMNT_0006965155 /DNA_START=74 /DNA_END=676 /DNA_ORIENTATION=+